MGQKTTNSSNKIIDVGDAIDKTIESIKEVNSEYNVNSLMRNIGQNGVPEDVTQGKGLGVRQHDDVMLAYGYSKKTWLEVIIPTGQAAVIKITVPTAIQHHAEARVLSTESETVRIQVLKDAVDGEFPAVVSTMPVVNQREDLPTNKLTNFEYCGLVLVAAIPSTGEEQTNFPLFTASGIGQSTSPSQSEGVKGRYSSEGLKAVIISNVSGSPTTVYYQYDWHEFEEA